jgi:hypothetical protein
VSKALHDEGFSRERATDVDVQTANRGIASTGDQAIRLERRFVGVELKPEYWQVGVRNLKAAESDMTTVDLFSWVAQEAEMSEL